MLDRAITVPVPGVDPRNDFVTLGSQIRTMSPDSDAKPASGPNLRAISESGAQAQTQTQTTAPDGVSGRSDAPP